MLTKAIYEVGSSAFRLRGLADSIVAISIVVPLGVLRASMRVAGNAGGSLTSCYYGTDGRYVPAFPHSAERIILARRRVTSTAAVELLTRERAHNIAVPMRVGSALAPSLLRTTPQDRMGILSGVPRGAGISR